MTQEEKELLLKDLCARLPYGVKITDGLHITTLKVRIDTAPATLAQFIHGENLRYYLRPMSSMTEGEREDFWKNVLDIDWRELEFDEEPDEVPFPFTENDCGFYLDNLYLVDLFAVIDWLNEHHFDYRGLIPKGLAISTKEFNPYKD